MKRLIPLLLLMAGLQADDELSLELDPLLKGYTESRISLNNRPLAKVMGKTISLVDVVKKMDVFLHQYYPQAFESKATLLQFYSSNWRPSLDEMVNNILILQEAETKEVKVSEGDVREEMEERFGPNIMAKLNKLGLGYEEARQMIHDEIAVRQMVYFKVHSKALQEITPQRIKESYVTYCKENPPQDDWTYQMLSIRSPDESLSEKAAKRAGELLVSGLHNLKEASDKLQEEFGDIKIALSNDISMTDRELSKMNRDILGTLKEGEISLPNVQKSRYDSSTVYRLFHLKEHQNSPTKSFDTVSSDLKDELIRDAVDRYHKGYVAHLRAKYHYDESEFLNFLPLDYQPFIAN